MSGLVLLDEAQQQSLYQQQQPPRAAATPVSGRIPSREPTHFFRRGVPRSQPTPTAEPPNRFVAGNPSRAEYLHANASLRTDFTTTRSTVDDYGAATKPSTITQNSSIHGLGPTDDAAALDELHNDSYPILRADPTRDSLESTTAQYAGTSSGLTISVRWIMLGLVAGVGLGLILN